MLLFEIFWGADFQAAKGRVCSSYKQQKPQHIFFKFKNQKQNQLAVCSSDTEHHDRNIQLPFL